MPGKEVRLTPGWMTKLKGNVGDSFDRPEFYHKIWSAGMLNALVETEKAEVKFLAVIGTHPPIRRFRESSVKPKRYVRALDTSVEGV